MVKCCIFMIGLVLVFGAIIYFIIGSWLFALILLVVGIVLISWSSTLEKDELKRKEEQKIQEEKERFLREKQWEKELEEKEAEVNTIELEVNSEVNKFCPQCGTKLNPEQKFCVGCGTPIN